MVCEHYLLKIKEALTELDVSGKYQRVDGTKSLGISDTGYMIIKAPFLFK